MKLPKVKLNPKVKYKKKMITIEVSTDASDADIRSMLDDALEPSIEYTVNDAKSTGEPEQAVAIKRGEGLVHRRFSIHQIGINTHQ